MRLSFEAEVFEWRGPAPFYFAAVPESQAKRIREISKIVTYGWGVIPCLVKVGKTEVSTSLFPKQGGYLVPLKDALRKPEKLTVGTSAKITLTIDV